MDLFKKNLSTLHERLYKIFIVRLAIKHGVLKYKGFDNKFYFEKYNEKMNKKYNHIIGIDPDTGKSGVAYLIKDLKTLEVTDLAFPELLDYLQWVKKESDENKRDFVVIVEASWHTSNNWHVRKGTRVREAAAIGNRTGRGHEVGRKIIEMCRHYDIEVVEQRPLKKCWKGLQGKITHEELVYFTGLMGRTNQEKRDAALLAWNYANLPIKMKV